MLANNTKIKKSEQELIELSNQTRLPSPSAAVNEASRFNPVDENNKPRKPKGGSSVALHFHKKRRVSQICFQSDCGYIA